MARGISIAALVFSIVLPIVGLILGIIALRQERSAGENGTMAIVAIAIGAIATIVGVFIVFVAGIAAFGVFNPERFAQERCFSDSFTGLVCTSDAVRSDAAQDTIAFELRNGAGERIRITEVSSSGDCSPFRSVAFDGSAPPVEYAPGEEFIVTASCDDIREGAVFEDEFAFTYDVVDGRSELETRVEVVVQT